MDNGQSQDRSAMPWNTRSWNASCVDGATGASYPWSQEELIEALQWGARSVPAYGVIRWEKEVRKEHAKDCLRHFIRFLRRLADLTAPEAHVAAETLYRAFLPFYGPTEIDCSKHRFGVALTTAIKTEVVPFRKFTRTAAHTVHYRGVSMAGLEDAFSYWIGEHPLPTLPEALHQNKSASGAA